VLFSRTWACRAVLLFVSSSPGDVGDVFAFVLCIVCTSSVTLCCVSEGLNRVYVSACDVYVLLHVVMSLLGTQFCSWRVCPCQACRFLEKCCGHVLFLLWQVVVQGSLLWGVESNK